MIKFNNIARTVRETTAPFEYTQDGELIVENIRVRYFSFTLADLKKMRSDALAKAEAAEKGDGDIQWMSSVLVQKLESLPDIVDGKGKPIAITEAHLDKFSAVNLLAINRAIDEDLYPKVDAKK